ncbi:MAG TPA: phosphoribosyl-AMP cyclohydrolase [Alphaproteobacteria bacterium]|jgi:phosphoribosyl-AMP cyclohydrolase
MAKDTAKEAKGALEASAEAVLAAIRFDSEGLVPAIAQQAETGEVLMLAWMDREAVLATLRTGEAHYHSRSRGRLWRKGESSGQTQTVREFRVDCDGDTVLLTVAQTGVACHTGRHTCFFRAARGEALAEIVPVTVSPDRLYGRKDGGDDGGGR